MDEKRIVRQLRDYYRAYVNDNLYNIPVLAKKAADIITEQRTEIELLKKTIQSDKNKLNYIDGLKGEYKREIKAIKKPIEVTAYIADSEMIIHTLEGDMKADKGDYIITGVNGEQYPCKPDVFLKTYDILGD